MTRDPMRKRSRHTQEGPGVVDAVNLTTLIRWCARFKGSYTLAKEEGSDGRWCLVVMRKPGTRPRVISDRKGDDLSLLVGRVAAEIRVTKEWLELGLLNDGSLPAKQGDGDKGEGEAGMGEVGKKDREYDYDIWDKRPRDLSGNLIEQK